jgi:hypothetical protein
MQYGQLITRSFSITWRFRYLWLLAILGGADVGANGFGGNFSSFNSGGRGGRQTSQVVQSDAGLIVAIVVVVVLVAVAYFLLSCLTTGALVRAAAEHDAERPFRLGLAWRAGAGTFWPILGLRLIALLLGLVGAAVIAGFVVLGIVSFTAGQGGAVAAVVVVGTLVFLALVVVAVAAGIVLILATRAIVLEQRGAIGGLTRGLQLMRARLGRVLLVWLVQVALGLGAAIGLFVAYLFAIVAVGLLVVGAYLAGGVLLAVLVGIPVGLVVLAALFVAAAIVGTYLSTYWTLAFRRMELEAPAQVAWPPPPAWPPQAAG